MPLRNKQRRLATVEGGLVTGYKVTKGQLWLSGYDERAGDELYGLPDGRYFIQFYPFEEAEGSDAIRNVRIWNADTGERVPSEYERL